MAVAQSRASIFLLILRFERRASVTPSVKRSLKPLTALSLLVLVAACGTPQERCFSRNTKDLQVVDRLLAETRANLQRGYGLETDVVRHLAFESCWRPGRPTADNPNPRPVLGQCRTTVERKVEKPVAVDLVAEARKLDQLEQRRSELQKDAKIVAEQCRAIYPE